MGMTEKIELDVDQAERNGRRLLEACERAGELDNVIRLELRRRLALASCCRLPQP